ncbi:hypothetical protein ES707_09820 [subsurface metagenome]
MPPRSIAKTTGYAFCIQTILGSKGSLRPLLDKLIRDADDFCRYLPEAQILQQSGHTATKATAQGVLLDGNQARDTMYQTGNQFNVKWLDKARVYDGGLYPACCQFMCRLKSRRHGDADGQNGDISSFAHHFPFAHRYFM